MALNLWEGLSVKWGDKDSFEEYATEALKTLERTMVRDSIIAMLLFLTGLALLYLQTVTLAVALLMLALYYNEQSSKSHVLLVLTAYQRMTARTLDRSR